MWYHIFYINLIKSAITIDKLMKIYNDCGINVLLTEDAWIEPYQQRDGLNRISWQDLFSDQTVSLLRRGSFYELCGPHILAVSSAQLHCFRICLHVDSLDPLQQLPSGNRDICNEQSCIQ